MCWVINHPLNYFRLGWHNYEWHSHAPSETTFVPPQLLRVADPVNDKILSFMEEDISGDIGLSAPLRVDPIPNTKSTRRAPPPAISLPQNNASRWKAPSPGSPTVLSPMSPTMPLSPSASGRLSRSRTMPRLSSRLEPQIHNKVAEDAEVLPVENIPKLNRWVISIAVVDCKSTWCYRSRHCYTQICALSRFGYWPSYYNTLSQH
jgi:hypothetical protein